MLLTSELLATAGGKVAGTPGSEVQPGLSATLTIADGLPEGLRARANGILSDLLEARTGFRSGRAEEPLPGEPRPAYDLATTTMTTRMAAKAVELGVAPSTLYLRWANYEAAGLVGLLDKRLQQPSRRPLGRRSRLATAS